MIENFYRDFNSQLYAIGILVLFIVVSTVFYSKFFDVKSVILNRKFLLYLTAFILLCTCFKSYQISKNESIAKIIDNQLIIGDHYPINISEISNIYYQKDKFVGNHWYGAKNYNIEIVFKSEKDLIDFRKLEGRKFHTGDVYAISTHPIKNSNEFLNKIKARITD